MKLQDTQELGDLIAEVFRLSSTLTAAGDELFQPLGITGARRMLMGWIANTPEKQSVAHLARNMGISRQAVQRLVNELVSDGFLEFVPNPHHQRSKLVAFTDAGATVYEQAMERRAKWLGDLPDDIPIETLERTRLVLQTLREQISALPMPRATS